MFGEDFKQLAGWVIACMFSVLAWFFGRAVKRVDQDIASHGQRIAELEAMKADIMLRPDVLALYSDQKEEFRQKFKEFREDQKELRTEMLDGIKRIQDSLDKIERRPKTQRAEDQ